ncbi:unnamed protein product [Albugo candida]|uniref:Pep3/Vps18 beta-propeller domain-containing protein n=1 Tax=Albugo candida TaxID=65357 RepID=A0A024G4Y4_9STRA|nr:unnamed protein product [Albugo candida]|eukprot:CCI41742.1 unnamed protein product [Albugo candida]
MSGDLFADWKKEEETFSSSSNTLAATARIPPTTNANNAFYESPYATVPSAQFDTSSVEDFDFETSHLPNQRGIIENDRPIFELREHGIKVSRRKGFTLNTMSVGNNIMALGSMEGLLLRCTVDATDSGGSIEEIMIEPRVAMSNLFLDPSGAHLLICMENGSNYYLHTSTNRPRKLSKAQGMQFHSVAWDRQQGSPTSTESILIGTDTGAVYEAEFENGKERSFKKVFEITNQGPIAAVEFEHWRMPSQEEKYYIMLVTSGTGKRPTRLFQFIGSDANLGSMSLFEAIFSVYSADKDLVRFQELPGEIGKSELRFFAKKERERARCFGLMTGDGVYHGNFIFGTGSELDNIMTGCDLLSYPKPSTGGSSRRSVPISLSVTEYHLILLYPKSIQVISKLNGVVVMEESFDSRVGTVHGISCDATFNTVWVHSDRRILEIAINDEDRNIWKLLLQKATIGGGDDRDFEKALSKCRNGFERQQVLTAQADKCFERDEFERAAVLYAKTYRSFEEVALKFLEKDTRDALRIFLAQKLKTLDPDEKTQKTVLCSWIVELFLDKFNVLKGTAQDVDAHANLLFEFKQFLQDHKQHLDPATTFQMIASHGRPDELVFYATLIEDYEKVVTYHIHRGDYSGAIEILRSVQASKVEELYYKYSPELIVHKPKELYEAWREAETLNPTRLIPSIVRHVHQQRESNTKANHQKRSVLELAIQYLNFAIKKGNRDPTIHNYNLFLLSKHPDERLLIKFLRKKHDGRHYFDIAFALRLCTQYEKNRACIYIYSAMSLYPDAVEKALQVDVKIAKEMANMPEDEELRKKLWTLIAKHTIDAGAEIKEAMGILKESKVLKIEDILPFFPDFVLINDFKKEICESLEGYNDRIEQLKEEMQDYTQSAELIRTDMQRLRKRCAIVSGNQRCELTGQNIVGKEFYLFPCSHAFLASALHQEMLHHLNSFQRQTVKQLTQKLNDLTTAMAKTQSTSRSKLLKGSLATALPFLNLEKETGGLSAAFSALSGSKDNVKSTFAPSHANSRDQHVQKQQQLAQEKEIVQQKLDDIIASECIFCGDIMIKSIHTPFLTPEDEAKEGADWAI